MHGWCYAQSLEGEKGYVPFSYLIPIFPTTEYTPEWQQLVSLRKNAEFKSRRHPSVRKEMVMDQRRSRLQAQTIKPVVKRSSNSIRFSESTYQLDNKDTSYKEKVALLKKIFVYYSEYIQKHISTLKPYEAWSFEGLYYSLYGTSRFNKISRSAEFNDQFKELMNKLHISVKNISSFIPLYFIGQPIVSKLEGSNKPLFVLEEKSEEFQEINPYYSSKVHETLKSAHNHLERMQSIREDITNLRNTVFSVNFIQETQNEIGHHKEEIKQLNPTRLSTDVELHSIPDIQEYSFYDFVTMYFQRDKTRFFHNASIEELASFSAKIPIHSLTCVDRSKLQDLLEMERWILSILGILNDNVTEESNEKWGHLDSNDSNRLLSLLYQLASRKDLVDEIFCFLVKESVDTPDSMIEMKVFEVLFVLLHCFLPSYHFFNYLACYFYKKIYNRDEIAGLALHSLFCLLNDAFVSADVSELKPRLMEALSCLEEVESVSLPLNGVGCSVKELFLLEKTASIFTSHSIPLDSSGLFDQVLPHKITEHIIDEKMLTNHLLNGVTLQVRLPEQKITKERVFWVSPSLDKICWQTRNHNRIYHIPVESILQIKVDTFEGTQAIFIDTNFNYFKTGASSRSLTKELYTILLFLPSLPETRRINLFLSTLCEWANNQREELRVDYAELSQEERIAFEAMTSQHQVRSSFVSIDEKRHTSFIHFLVKKVKGLESKFFEKKESNGNNELFKVYKSTIPRLYIRILSRLKELKAYDVRGVFRENGDTQQRDRYLKLLGDGCYDCLNEIEATQLLTSIFKRLFFVMEEPLIPYAVYDEIMVCDTSNFDECMQIISKMPKESHDVLFFILQMLCCYLDHPGNSLSAQGFIICFTPTLLRCKEIKDFETTNKESMKGTDFLVTILQTLHKRGSYKKGLFD